MRRYPPHLLGHYLEAARESEEACFRSHVAATLAGTHPEKSVLDEILGAGLKQQPGTTDPAETAKRWSELARSLNRPGCVS